MEHYGYDDCKKSVEESLKKLKTDYIDLMLLHQPFSDYYGAWHALEDLYEEGVLRAIGVSNFYPDRLVDIASFSRIAPMVNQVETHPHNQQTAFTTYKWRHYNEKLLMMLAAILVLGLTACGQSDVNSSNNVEESKTNTTESKTEETTPATDKASEDTESAQNDTMKNEKILVAYFSASGNTERIAEIIADATGANTFEIVPENPYSNDGLNWRDESSRVCREHDNPDERDIALQIVTSDEWESYSIVYVIQYGGSMRQW